MTAKLHQFSISAGIDSRTSRIEIDGKRIEGVRRISFDRSATGESIPRLEVMGEIKVEGQFRESAIIAVDQKRPPF